MTATAYLEKYFDCVDALPLDLQRFVTGLREVERETQGLLVEVRRLECCLEEGQYGVAEEKQRRALLQLQRCILKLREAGDEKLSISSQLLDTVEDYTQQLALRLKVLDNPRSSSDDHHHPSRYSNASVHSTVKGESTSTVTAICEGPLEKSQGKKSISAKRQRSSDKSFEEEGGTALKESGGRSRENSTVGTTILQGGGKPPKKKIKMKKKAVKESTAALHPPTQVPMPDLNSQPLDPDEPTYCLCNQVSFGEMIGCDNEECPIEWFHFQCVGLTSKPKGKWYCPQCSTEKKPRTAK